MPSPNESACVALRLRGPMQSWGTSSTFSHRTTGLFPSKSGIAGLVCAAFGFDRGSLDEQEFLPLFNEMHMAVAARIQDGELRSSRLVDFHTIQGAATAEGKRKDCHTTWRHYLTDAEFCVCLSGKGELVKRIAAALEDPVWGVWLGRKNCIPSAPLLVGVYEDQTAALAEFFSGGRYVVAEDAEGFGDADDYQPDNAVSFKSSSRVFRMRAVKLVKRD